MVFIGLHLTDLVVLRTQTLFSTVMEQVLAQVEQLIKLAFMIFTV